MIDLTVEYGEKIFGLFIDPKKRIFLGFLAAAGLIGLAFLTFRYRISPRRAIRHLFTPKVWLSSSAKADYRVFALNQAVMMGLAPRLLSKLVLATLIFEYLHIVFAGRPSVALWLPAWGVALAYTVTQFLLDDASKYLLHRWLHRWPVLWAFHKVHHSAETLTPFTVFRTHPVEGVLFALRATLVQAVTVAVFVFFFSDRADLATILGANLFLFLFNAFGSNLRHTHLKISYGPMIERFLISPMQHQIHHSLSPRHFDKNFGAVLAIWDWMGNSLYRPQRSERLRFGLIQDNDKPHALSTLYAAPLSDAARCVTHSLIKGWQSMTKTLSAASLQKARLGLLALMAGLTAFFMFNATKAEGAELNIYSHRQPFLIEPFIEAYTAETGTKINIVYASKGLAQRLQAEGELSPADVILTVDIARLSVYADKDLLAPVDSEILMANIPVHLRDPENRWFAFSKRTRVLVISKEVDDADSLQRYEDLASEAWEGRICSRPGSHVYNRALIASIIDASGKEAAEAWATGVVANLARRPQGNDRAQVKAIHEGVCDVAIVNNYYIGKLLASDDPVHREWGASVDIIFPNQEDRGAHINISGGGVAKYSQNKEEAVRFLEFLTSETAQILYGTVNYEYPVNPNIPASEALQSWGAFLEDDMPIARISELAPTAQRIIDRVGW